MPDSEQRQPADLADDVAERLVAEARSARTRSHAPYSNFRMGAAVLAESGEVVSGFLVENVALPLTVCAERVAMLTALASGAGRPRALALVSKRTSGSLTWPCGACLQVAQELGGPEVVVIAADLDGETEARPLRELAPRLPRIV